MSYLSLSLEIQRRQISLFLSRLVSEFNSFICHPTVLQRLKLGRVHDLIQRLHNFTNLLSLRSFTNYSCNLPRLTLALALTLILDLILRWIWWLILTLSTVNSLLRLADPKESFSSQLFKDFLVYLNQFLGLRINHWRLLFKVNEVDGALLIWKVEW